MSVLIRTLALAACAAVAGRAGVRRRRRLRCAANDTEGKGPAYFGFVRDHRGSPVSDAQVILRPKTGEPVVLKTNVLGLYRSHVSKEVPPADVEVSCEQERLQAGRRDAPPRPGQRHAHRDQLHAAAAVDRDASSMSRASVAPGSRFLRRE